MTWCGRRRTASAVVAVVACCLSSGCDSSSHKASRGAPTSTSGGLTTSSVLLGSGVLMRSGAPIPHATATISPRVRPTIAGGLRALSATFKLSPSGPLPSTVQVTVPLRAATPVGDAVVVATSETANGPWSYLVATVNPSRRSATFVTDHFSWFSILGYDLKQAEAEFESSFLDGLDSGATTIVNRPNCANETGARSDGYTIASSTTNTVYWCFGMSGAQRALTVVNNRRYPLEIAHPALVVRRGFGLVVECGAASADFGDDVVRDLVPDEGFGVVVPV